MKKFILSLAVLIAASFAANAQVLDFYVGADVNGINGSSKCNYDKFVSVFGKPDKYICSGDPNGDDFSETYYIGKNTFSFSFNGELYYFELGDKRFAALTKFIKGGVRLGDKISKLDNIKYGKPVPEKPNKDGTTWYDLWESSYDPVYFHVKDGIILRIVYSAAL